LPVRQKQVFLADFRGFRDLARGMLRNCGRRHRGEDGMKTEGSQETEMFNYDRFAKVATAAVGALVLSTLSIGAAVGPAAAQSPVAGWIGQTQFKA
jgi:hypothetical protein